MSAEDQNFDKCRCCLKAGRFKNMWEDFIHDGKQGTYGEMLATCFAISLEQPAEYPEQICGACVKRLLDALSFKELVLASEKLLLQLPDGFKIQIIKEEGDFTHESGKEKESKESIDGEIGKDSNMDNEVVAEGEKECLEAYSTALEHDGIDGTEYLEVEFRDNESSAVAAKQVTSIPSRSSRREKNLGRLKRLAFTEAELHEAMEAVRNKTMTRAQASVYYNISLKNLRWKMRAEETRKEGEGGAHTNNKSDEIGYQLSSELTNPPSEKPKRTMKPRELSEKETLNRKNYNNIRVILMSSNATPIQGHHGIGFTCCFCPGQYLKASELKSHTLEVHTEDKSEFMKTKDAWEFCVKLDITGLRCLLCEEDINNLDFLIHHLITTHGSNIYLDAVKQIIPFRFDGNEFCCALCGVEFQYFKLLSQHMNEHYSNFVCKDCDRGFVNKSSLRTHEYRHKYGEFRCTYCRKEFQTAIRQRDHERVVHRMNCRTHKCGYCDEKFSDAPGRHKHETEVHGVEPRQFKCNACDSTFARQTSLTDHVNAFHLFLKQHECAICCKQFLRKKTLKRHVLTHTGTKDFECSVCRKSFSRKSGLIEHMRIHDNDRRYKCDYCGNGFVQRVTLKTHMKSKHGVVLGAGTSASGNTT